MQLLIPLFCWFQILFVNFFLSLQETVFAAGKKFLDTVTWQYSEEQGAVCLCVRKISHPDGNYELVVSRYLQDNGQTIKCVAVFNPLKLPGKKRVEAITYFSKVGPSPNPRPESVAEDGENDGDSSISSSGPSETPVQAGGSVKYSPAPEIDSESQAYPPSGARTQSINAFRERVNSRMKQRSNSHAHSQHVPRDFSGVWNRTRTVNFEAFIGRFRL